MAEESFLLLSLKEEKSKKLAQVISNETSRKILDYMGSKGSQTITETELAKSLRLPISTVHYNMKHLVKAGLVKTDEFHYSEKGKEVNHYSLSNKMIIIAPSNSEKFLEKLKKIIPVALVAVAAAGVIQIFGKFFGNAAGGVRTLSAPIAENSPQMLKTAAESGVVTDAVQESASAVVQATATTGAQAAPAAADVSLTSCSQTIVSAPASASTYAIWFLFGAIFTLVLYFVWDWIKDKRK